ncbi:serine/threonine-protein phosphatase [Streptomyces marianii]|uniref:Serine/threonine-protein phosphatase n=2 Tax=Streptomyces marianii TaxID=1817406 RepID=A0A5R9EFX2_9ACTN|nr:serine/threonine-protein phosphatase [Streptomyces marianii]
MLSGLLKASHLATFEQLPALVSEGARRAGLGDVRVFVADLQQDFLREVTGRGIDAGLGGQELRIDATMAGRAFMTAHTLSTVTGDREQYWLPVLDGTERLGVLRADARPDGGGDAAETMEALASLVGLLLVSKRANSDSFARLTRVRPMTVSAEMQWTLMPPRTFANGTVTIAAQMEPAYETAGDAFDYALAADVAHLAVFDAMGHDTTAGLTANLAMAVCRNRRRHGASLADVCQAVEQLLVQQFDHACYTTALLADLDLVTGRLAWVTCGHLPPVLIRDGRWVAHPECPPCHPLGTELGMPLTVCREQLQPGDRFVLYTDGITEARDADGEEFGLGRFVDFVIRRQADGLPVPETLRRLIHAVLDHHHGKLKDDATVLICEWHGNRHTAGHAQTKSRS